MCGVLSAQDIKTFSNIQYLSADEGLSQREVTCILQDKQGFIWIGTRGGLNRYDGYSFKIFQNEIGNTNSLNNNSIESLFEDSKGNIWIGTKSNGLSMYNPEFDRFEHFQNNPADSNSLRANRIISIAESEKGELWFGSWENGLFILNLETGKFRNVLKKEKISAILKTRDDNMWIATNRSLQNYTREGKPVNRFQSSPSYAFVHILEDRITGKLFLGTWNQGLFTFDRTEKTFIQYKRKSDQKGSISSNNAYHLFQDKENRIWIGTWGEGLNLFEPNTGTFVQYSLLNESLKGGKELYKDVLCIFQDQSGILYFGTNGGGICKVDKYQSQFGQIQNSGRTSDLPKEPVWSMMKDQEGILWVGIKGSPYLHYSQDGKKFSRIKIPGQSSMNSWFKKGARLMYQAEGGTRWFTTQFGLYKVLGTYGKYELQRIDIKESRENRLVRQRQISSIYQSRDGTFWIGRQQNGLRRSLFPGMPGEQVFKVYGEEEERGQVLNNRISSLLEDKKGQFWIGTYGGLYKYQAKSDDFLHFSKQLGNESSLSSDIIICLYEDRKGNLWIGTPNGLNLAVPASSDSLAFTCFQEKDGLPNNYIQSIQEDDHGNLWISTNKGISKFNLEEKVFYNYDLTDGLLSNSFMEGASFKDQDGTLYFGGIYGFTFFHPDSIQENTIPPAVFLTGIKVLNNELSAGKPFNDRIVLSKSIEFSEKIALNYNENAFSIDYTALDFQNSSGNTYKYRMNGLEEDWNSVGQKRSVTYTNLKPGTYTFQVKAANNDGIWNEEGAKLHIEILPPFWATWQAFLFYAFVFAGLLLLYRHFISRQNELKNKLELSRMAREKEVEMAELKSRFFTNITHELRTPLTLISGPVGEIMDKEKLSGKLKDYMLTIHQNTQRLLNLVNQLLDFRKAETGNMQLEAAEGDFVRFGREVFLSFQELAEQHNIQYTFNPSHKHIPLCFDRDKMEIVLCNLLSNAFKYVDKAGEIELSISKHPVSSNGETPAHSEGFCQITVKDNGRGMPEDLLEKVFDRFYQIANADSVKIVGTGIGLSLAKNIVELHKGEIAAESELGKGASFNIKLPLGSAHFEENQLLNSFRDSEDVSHYQEPTHKTEMVMHTLEDLLVGDKNHAGSLLIVEDNDEIRAFIHSIFAEDFQVIVAENGKVGLELALKHLPDLIISDLMMPEMDGLSFCKRVKEAETTAHIPVILLTARTATVFQVEGYQSGADAFISKPFHSGVLKAQVNGLLNSRQRMKDFFGKKVTLVPTETEIDSLDEKFLNQAMELVEANINKEVLNRDFMADALAMSPSSLYRKIKLLTGLTTNAFIRSIRLKRAAQLLQSSQYNISEIAFMVGFNDQKYFRNSFREQFGMNPSEYLKKEIQAADSRN